MRLMVRRYLTVLLGFALSFLLTAAGGYLVYHIRLSYDWSEAQLGALVRYLFDPMIAAIVGGVVGALSKRRAGILAALSLIPWAIMPPLFRGRLYPLHEAILVSLSLCYVLVGPVVAQLVFWRRAGTNINLSREL